MTGEGRAPGKVILLGEHAVVYGHPALAAALPLGVTVRAEPVEGAGVALEGAPDERASRAAQTLARRLGVSGARLQVRSELPAGAGLGSSAAFAVAAARALAGLAGREPDAAELDALALEAEGVFHGNPSGLDPYVCAHGGLVLFRRGPPAQAQPVKAAKPLPLLLIFTGQARETGTLVAAVAAAREADPGRTDRVLARLGELAQAGRDDVERGDWAALGVHLSEAHRLLARAGVSTPELDRAVETAVRAGARGAKLTGAGGGGTVVALAPEPGPVQDALRRRGFQSRYVEIA